MDFMGKELEKLVVTLPMVDGTEMDCGVFSYFEVDDKQYFALLPLDAEGKFDYTKSYMLYRVEKDEEQNPVVMYIEDDSEYAIAAKCFSDNILHKNS